MIQRKWDRQTDSEEYEGAYRGKGQDREAETEERHGSSEKDTKTGKHRETKMGERVNHRTEERQGEVRALTRNEGSGAKVSWIQLSVHLM